MKLDLSNLKGDITGGLTAGIVALPLALALGVASGLGPMAGLYGAIALGFFAALFGGTPSQISGPTGPMVVVLAGLFASLSGDAALIFTAVMLAGLFQIVFGLLGVGQYIRLVPYPVISGFMTGIGAIIIILQLGRLLGHEPPSGTIGALSYIPTALADINIATLILGIGTLLIAYKWPPTLGKYIPGPLAALVIGTLASFAFSNVPALGNIPTGLPSLHLPVYEQSQFFLILEAAFILAILGAIDSLLTSLVADNMTRTRHDSKKELIGQGIGNTVAGLIGGIAGAGATMRTVVNIRTGGKTRISGMVHSLVLLAVVLGLSPLAASIPHAVLAGLLVKVGLDIIDWSYLKRAHNGPRWDFALMILVLGLTVFVDLVTAVGVGVVLAALAFVRQIAQIQIEDLKKIPDTLNDPKENALLKQADGRVSIFSFGGPLSFGAAADVGHHVRDKVKPGSQVLIMDFTRVPTVDVSAGMAVETVATDAKSAGRKLIICGANDAIKKVLKGINAAQTDVESFDNLLGALEYAVEIINKDPNSPKALSNSTKLAGAQ
ncbi:SulP family inorganic anion transporter [Aliiglaciecola sp. 2_MG-2023]|uniref:SulP family inorganic anion transporter n=1 Tax=unclassified Aliiglaciecola TaxID=2593648 RepID=UPI0026E1E7E2|nr:MULTISPECIES: SulP family inorganic anion transporter [unclassified Aliiglaciecola]MDO6711914.1 SulP family inorganic anion transporter [Aliiglaciecola sp. 2_MG-2023]MDO6753112.1 SulP family inorganic anion transporter [Aliiglaciecola sp. 1_MG-2023]